MGRGRQMSTSRGQPFRELQPNAAKSNPTLSLWSTRLAVTLRTTSCPVEAELSGGEGRPPQLAALFEGQTTSCFLSYILQLIRSPCYHCTRSKTGPKLASKLYDVINHTPQLLLANRAQSVDWRSKKKKTKICN